MYFHNIGQYYENGQFIIFLIWPFHNIGFGVWLNCGSFWCK